MPVFSIKIDGSGAAGGAKTVKDALNSVTNAAQDAKDATVKLDKALNDTGGSGSRASTVKKTTDATTDYNAAAREARDAAERVDSAMGKTTGAASHTQAVTGVDRAYRSTTNSIKQFNGGLQGGGGADAAIASLKGLAVQIGLAALAYKALKTAVEEVYELTSRGLDFNAELESARIGIGSIIAATMDVKDAQGGMVSGMEKFTGAQVVARDLMKQIQIAGLETTAQTKDLVGGFQTLLGPASAVGFTLKQTEDFVLMMVQSMGALGIEANQLSAEGRSLLDGSINPMQDRLATALGITGDMVSQWKEQNTLFAELQKRMEAFKFAGNELANSWAGLKSNVADAISYLAGESTSGLFDGIKKSWQELLAALVDTKNFQPGPMVSNLVAGFKEINSELGSGIVSATKAFVAWLGQANEYAERHKEQLSYIWDSVKGVGQAVLDLAGEAFDLLETVAKWGTESGTFALVLGTLKVGMAAIAQAGDYLVLGLKTAAAAVVNVLLPPISQLLSWLGKMADFAGFKDFAASMQQVSQGYLQFTDSVTQSMISHARQYKDSTTPVFDSIMEAARQSADEQKKSQEDITNTYKAEATKKAKALSNFSSAYQEYAKNDTAYQLKELDKQFADYKQYADDKLKVDELYNSKKADILSKDPAFAAYEKLYKATGAKEYYNKLIDLESQLLDAQVSGDQKATGSLGDALKLREVKMKDYINSLSGTLAQAQPAAQSFTDSQTEAFQDTSESLQALKDNLQGYIDLLNDPGNFSSPFDDQNQNSGGGTSASAYGNSTGQYVTTVEIPHSLANERYWYYGTVNGTDYYSKTDYETAVENAQQAQEESQRLADQQQAAIDEQNKQWVDLEQSYYKLGQTLSKSTTSFDADGIRRGLDRVSQSIGDATTFLDELQAQADALQSLKSSWTDFDSSIGDALTTLQRSGWGLSDYVAAYNSEMASLSAMAPGSQEALAESQKVLSLISQISSLQTQATETQASNLEQQEQEQEQALTTLKDSWASLKSSISSEITSQARSGWTSADYLSEYQRQNLLLSSMDQGTQEALDTATSMLDLLKSIESTQSEELKAQESLNNSLLNIFSSVDSTLSSLQSSTLSPVQSMEQYQQQYSAYLQDATTAIQNGMDDASNKVQSYLDYAKTYLTYAQSYGGDYQGTYDKTTADISGLKNLSGYQLLSGGVVTDLDKLRASLASAGNSTNTLATKLGTSSGGLSSAAQQSSSFVQWLASYLAGGGSLSLATASSATSGLIQSLSGQVSQLSANAGVASTSVTNAADGTSTLGSTLDTTNGATFNAISAYQALQTATTSSAQSVANSMTQLLNAINSAVASIASQSGQTVNVTVSPVNAYTPTTHTTQEADWSWVQTGYRNNGVNPSTGMVDTYISGYWHTSHSPQYSGGWWVTTGRQPTHPDSYTYTYQAAEGGIARSTPGGLPVTVAEAGYDEMFTPLNSTGIEKTVSGLGYGSDNIKSALKEAVQKAMSPVLAALVEAINAGSGGDIMLDGQKVGQVVAKRLLRSGEFVGTLDRRYKK